MSIIPSTGIPAVLLVIAAFAFQVTHQPGDKEDHATSSYTIPAGDGNAIIHPIGGRWTHYSAIEDRHHHDKTFYHESEIPELNRWFQEDNKHFIDDLSVVSFEFTHSSGTTSPSVRSCIEFKTGEYKSIVSCQKIKPEDDPDNLRWALLGSGGMFDRPNMEKGWTFAISKAAEREMAPVDYHALVSDILESHFIAYADSIEDSRNMERAWAEIKQGDSDES